MTARPRRSRSLGGGSGRGSSEFSRGVRGGPGRGRGLKWGPGLADVLKRALLEVALKPWRSLGKTTARSVWRRLQASLRWASSRLGEGFRLGAERFGGFVLGLVRVLGRGRGRGASAWPWACSRPGDLISTGPWQPIVSEERPQQQEGVRKDKGQGPQGHQGLVAAGLLSVKQLKAQAAELGLDTSRCTERADLLSLLSAGGGLKRPMGGQSTTNNTSNNNNNNNSTARAAQAQAGGAQPLSAAAFSAGVSQPKPSPSAQSALPRPQASPQASGSRAPLTAGPRQRERESTQSGPRLQREEILRIARATDDLAVLGLSRQELADLLGRAERERAVLRRFRQLSRLVHPDKCAPELREAATRAFQRLEVARQGCSAMCLQATLQPVLPQNPRPAAQASTASCQQQWPPPGGPPVVSCGPGVAQSPWSSAGGPVRSFGAGGIWLQESGQGVWRSWSAS
ncbi:unnamed protein product [Polarella glacialis]|uniref:J domain-containing protein n=1 Tax=Polarella glacialis TaxID=89957 RepID=A0A813JH06_POLGL|nr:unnamed protein product [Polarella glacialis]